MLDRFFTFKSLKKKFPYLIILLIIGLLISLNFYREEINKIDNVIHNTEQSQIDMQWQFIEDCIKDGHLIAGNQAKILARDIDRNFRQAYPNMDTLKKEMEMTSGSDPNFPKIIKDNISGIYFYNIKNDRNDLFVANNKGMLMDMSLSRSVGRDSRLWEDEINRHYNKQLSVKTIEKLLVKTYDILYWEIDAPVSKHHMVITDPTMENLRALFYKEGLEGLKNIEFISAAYITDSGDIFGVDDIDNKGLRQSNHKIIVIQGFSVYDLIKQNHMQTYNSYEILKKQIVSDLSTVKLIRTLAITASAIVIIVIAFVLMTINNRIFHDHECYRLVNKQDTKEDGHN